MEIGVYLCLTCGLGILVLLSLPALRQRLLLYGGLSLLLALLALVAFALFSVRMGIIQPGQVRTYSYPQDYLAPGPVGWLVALLPIAGILAPVAAAFLLGRARQKKNI